MPETPKVKTGTEEKHDTDAAWADDQTRHEYYYDDAHGYEVFTQLLGLPLLREICPARRRPSLPLPNLTPRS